MLTNQLLFDKSYENGVTNGLGLLPGEVKRFKSFDSQNQIQKFNVGWRKILVNSKLSKKTCCKNF